METLITRHMKAIECGEVQTHLSMEVIPLCGGLNHGPHYLTLGEAQEKGFIRVTEVSEGGSVPDLFVVNQGGCCILLLDGEELAGAKQNRVLNTSILAPEKGEIKIPVSCTEQGRWTYDSLDFKESGHVAHPRLRSRKSASVSQSLHMDMRFSSDQMGVWEDVEAIASMAKVYSPTSALRDVFESRKGDLNACIESFSLQPGQKGVFVRIEGRVTGLDMVSSETAYQRLHSKLIRSYAMEALLNDSKPLSPLLKDEAKTFVLQASKACDRAYKSVGHGYDHRIDGEGVIGSALVWNETVVHLALFPGNGERLTGKIADVRRRRHFRM